MHGLKVTEVADEIKALSNIAEYGKLRLTEFGNRSKQLSQQLSHATHYDAVTDFITNTKQFHNSILASHKAITDWKQKVESYLAFVHDAARNNVEDKALLSGLSTTIADLMKTFSSQLTFLQQLQDKNIHFIQQADRKRKTLAVSFERGNAPVLIDDMDDEDLAGAF